MNENFAEDEVIGRLIREEGLLSTSPGFTDRVMQLVESSTQIKETSFKPLINGKTWMIIAVAVAFLLMVCIIVSATGNPGQLSYFRLTRSLTDILMVSHLPQKIDSGFTMLVTLILVIVSFLLFVDLLLNNRLRGLIK
jgi:hypothetical protein